MIKLRNPRNLLQVHKSESSLTEVSCFWLCGLIFLLYWNFSMFFVCLFVSPKISQLAVLGHTHVYV